MKLEAKLGKNKAKGGGSIEVNHFFNRFDSTEAATQRKEEVGCVPGLC